MSSINELLGSESNWEKYISEFEFETFNFDISFGLYNKSDLLKESDWLILTFLWWLESLIQITFNCFINIKFYFWPCKFSTTP